MIELMIFIWAIGCTFTIGFDWEDISNQDTLESVAIAAFYLCIWPLMLGRLASIRLTKK